MTGDSDQEDQGQGGHDANTMLPPPLIAVAAPPAPEDHRPDAEVGDEGHVLPTMVTANVDDEDVVVLDVDSSWASTPSSSTRFIFSSRPVVTATAACFGLRPVAKALGAGRRRCTPGVSATRRRW
jgi:hypothetical protein